MSKIKHFLYFIPAILWYSLIWSLSAQPADVSTDVSHGVTGNMMAAGDALVGTPVTPPSTGGVTPPPSYSVAMEDVQMVVKELLSFFIRKGAHMFLFFVLAILIWFAMTSLIKKRPMRTFCTILPCTALAALDEFHQTLVPGRSGELRDVLVDLSGSLIAMLLFALPFIGLWLCRKLKHPERLWIIGACVGAVLLVYVGLLKGLAPIFVPWVGNSPVLAEFASEELAALVDSAAPILRQLLYLLSCAVTGALSVFLAALSENRRAILTAFAVALCLSLVSGMIWTLPSFAGVVLCLIGGCVALALRKCFPLLSK